MKKNIGMVDRLIRLILSFVLLSLAYWNESWILFILGLFVLFEALIGWCVVYQIFGKNTCPTKKN